MVEKTFTVNRPEGFHLRPAGQLSKCTKDFDCTSTLVYNGQEIDCKNVISIVAAAMKSGAEFTIKCEGPEEEKCLAAVSELADKNFGD